MLGNGDPDLSIAHPMPGIMHPMSPLSILTVALWGRHHYCRLTEERMWSHMPKVTELADGGPGIQIYYLIYSVYLLLPSLCSSNLPTPEVPGPFES